jgi:hypothetical protein
MVDSTPDYRPTASLARAWSRIWTSRALASVAPASRVLPRRWYEPALRPGKPSGTPSYDSTAGDPVESTV